MNTRSDLARSIQRKILVIAPRHLLLWLVQNLLGRSHMQIKNIAYATFVAAAAVAIVIGSAVPSEAAKKKKAAAAAPPARPEVVCVGPASAVCASKGDQKFTYHNACWAAKDGAKGAKAGECKAASKKVAKKKG
jgi:hypothetical protein